MTYQHKKNQVNTLYRLSVFVAWACVFQMIESLFPNPLPGLRLGLANMVTLVVLFEMGWGAALEVAILRVLISSMMFGSFLSPAFILSLSAAISSTLIMGLLLHLSIRQEILRFSLIGISIGGALTHTMTQLAFVYLLLIRHPGIFRLAPWLMIASVCMGVITGIIARHLCRDLGESHFVLGRREVMRLLRRSRFEALKHEKVTFLNRINPTHKIVYVLLIALLVILIENLQFYFGLLLFTFSLILIGRIPVRELWPGIQKMGFFLLTLFFALVLFTPQGHSFFQPAGIMVMRLLILLLNSSLVSLTTPAEELASHLSQLLSPLRLAKFSPSRFSRILIMSWTLIPSFMDQAFALMRTTSRHLKTLPNIAGALSTLILKTIHSAGEELHEEITLAVESADHFIDMKKRR